MAIGLVFWYYLFDLECGLSGKLEDCDALASIHLDVMVELIPKIV